MNRHDIKSVNGVPDTAIIVVWRKFTLLISWPVAPDIVIIMVWRRLHKTNIFKPGAALRKVIPEMIFLSAAPRRKMHYRHNLESVCIFNLAFQTKTG